MKDYKEMSEDIFRRRDEYMAKRQRRTKKIAAAVSGVCLIALLTTGICQGVILQGRPDDGQTPGMTQTAGKQDEIQELQKKKAYSDEKGDIDQGSSGEDNETGNDAKDNGGNGVGNGTEDTTGSDAKDNGENDAGNVTEDTTGSDAKDNWGNDAGNGTEDTAGNDAKDKVGNNAGNVTDDETGNDTEDKRDNVSDKDTLDETDMAAKNKETNADEETDSGSSEGTSIDAPVQEQAGATGALKPYEEFWGGSYMDENGCWVVLLTEDTPENRQKVFEYNPSLKESSTIFRKADYTKAYLTELMAVISKAMGNNELPNVSSAALSEDKNRVVVYMTSEDEASVLKVNSFDTLGGAIEIVYSGSDVMEKADLIEKPMMY